MNDIILRGGMIYDGNGDDPKQGDIGIRDDVITEIGAAGTLNGYNVIDVDGLAVAPGFINMLSWATESLILDGKSESDIRQGVTLEIMGEGSSMGPLNEAMKNDKSRSLITVDKVRYQVEWTTLREYLEFLERKGVSTNVASYVGHGTLREYAMGYADRAPTEDEMLLMKSLLSEAMEDGAMGMSSALIYPPMVFAQTDEIIELAKIVAEHDGVYVSHIRNEGSTILEALDEFMQIVRESGARGEIYHLKAAGQSNWDKMDIVLERINTARAEGLPITSDMYTYPASGTGLTSCLPPWTQEGGHDAMVERLKNPDLREKIKADMVKPADEWENMYEQNSPEKIMLAGFRTEALKQYTGKRLSEVAEMRGTSPKDTVLDLIVEDDSRIFTIYFTMTDDNLRKQIQQPWVSFCSDAGSIAPEPPFTNYHPHPRAYGSFARVLGKFVREEKALSLQQAIRQLAALPAEVMKIDKRGRLLEGYFADIAVFDPEKVQDHATYDDPHHYSTGMVHVFVNGGQVLRDGDHTGLSSGRVVYGPGFKNG